MNTKEGSTKRRGHVRWSVNDRNQLMEEHRKSGKSKKKFCEERGINLGTFYGWAKQGKIVQRKKVRTRVQAFKEMSVPIVAGHNVEVILPGGARVCLRNNGNQEELIKLVRGVAGC